MRKKYRSSIKYWQILLASIALCLALADPAWAASDPPGTKTWVVLVGGEAGMEPQEYGPAGAWQFMRFYPENITINEGDTIVWELKSTEPHTVTFPLPGEKSPDPLIPEGNDSQRMIFNPLAVLSQGDRAYNGTVLTGSG